MDLKRALQTYTVLTIGDGLVTVIPALMISISGGLIVTRASSDNADGHGVSRQVFGNAAAAAACVRSAARAGSFSRLAEIPFLLLRRGAWGRRLADAGKICSWR